METIKIIKSDFRDFWYNAGIYAIQNQAKGATSEFNPATGTSERKHSYDKMIYELPEFKPEQIDCTYIGIPGKCMCGCSGKYSYPKINQEQAGKHRGYPVNDEYVSDRRVQMAINKMRKNASKGIEVIHDYIYTIIIGSRQYSLYIFEGESK